MTSPLSTASTISTFASASAAPSRRTCSASWILHARAGVVVGAERGRVFARRLVARRERGLGRERDLVVERGSDLVRDPGLVARRERGLDRDPTVVGGLERDLVRDSR